jgi:hypothetical protein
VLLLDATSLVEALDVAPEAPPTPPAPPGPWFPPPADAVALPLPPLPPLPPVAAGGSKGATTQLAAPAAESPISESPTSQALMMHLPRDRVPILTGRAWAVKCDEPGLERRANLVTYRYGQA